MDILDFINLANDDCAAAQRYCDGLSYGRLNEILRYLESEGNDEADAALGIVLDAIADIESNAD